MSSNPVLSIFFHNYYGDDQQWLNFLCNELDIPFYLFYNYVSDSYSREAQPDYFNSEMHRQPQTIYLNQIYFRKSTNKGKDIGGKLVLMDAYMKLGIGGKYILLLHDKQSLHQHNGQKWRRELFRIVEKNCMKKAIEIFQGNAQVGIIAAASAIRNEWDNEQKSNNYTNSSLIEELKNRYQIQPPHLQFVAGTMFWVRASIFEAFFKKHPPLAVRAELEEGNVMDDQPTLTHAWERLLCWIATSQGYQIVGI